MAARIVTLEDCRGAAAEVFRPEYVDQWLASPNEILEGSSPAWLVGIGEGDRVLALIDALAEGVVGGVRADGRTI